MSNVQIVSVTKPLLAKQIEDQLQAMPKGFNKERFLNETLTVLNNIKDLNKLTGNNKEFLLAKAIMQGAYLGLSFASKECYIIPYSGVPEFMTDYKGEKKLCYKYSVRPIKNIYADIVREGDEFSYSIVDNSTIINFKPIPFSTKNIVGSFAAVEYEDGIVNVEMLNIEDIKSIKNASKMNSNGPWKTFYGEMCKKAAIRRLTKNIQLDFNEFQNAAWVQGSQMDFEKPTVASATDELNDNIINANDNVIDADFKGCND